MKCQNCSQENKTSAKDCKKCGRDLTIPPSWFPDWHWHSRALGIIYAFLVVFYFVTTFALRQLPKPYHIRDIPKELTPWLNK